MISLMAYAVLIACLFGLAANFGERICAELGRARRWIWLVALAGSIALPAVAVIGPGSPDEPGGTLPGFSLSIVPPVAPANVPDSAIAASDSGWLQRFDWAILDSALVAVWAASSVVMLLFCVIGVANLLRNVRRSETTEIDDQRIAVSDRLGPAVVGFFRPSIVLPRWLAFADSDMRALVLSHEREHVAARDQLSLLAALLLVLCMPWNPALWWQLRRLRASIEFDCDARVLRGGANSVRYSKALLYVRQHRRGMPFGAVALTEPVSELERRIRIMMEKARRISVSRVGARSLLALSFVAVAFAVETPRAQQTNDTENATEDPNALPAIRSYVFDLMNAALECMEVDDQICARAELGIVLQQNLNDYETAQYWRLMAFVELEEDNVVAAIDAFENVLDIDHDNMPDGLIEDATRSLGALYQRTGQHELALEKANELLELRGITGLDVQPFLRGRDGTYLPIAKVAPTYPQQAREQGLEGYVIVRYTVTTTGDTANIEVIESSSSLFDQAAVESAQKYKYKPRVIDGTPIAVPGVTTRIIFEL